MGRAGISAAQGFDWRGFQDIAFIPDQAMPVQEKQKTDLPKTFAAGSLPRWYFLPSLLRDCHPGPMGGMTSSGSGQT